MYWARKTFLMYAINNYKTKFTAYIEITGKTFSV